MKKRVGMIIIGFILVFLPVLLIMGRRVDVQTDKRVEGLSQECQLIR